MIEKDIDPFTLSLLADLHLCSGSKSKNKIRKIKKL
jgi:hypothetical protein